MQRWFLNASCLTRSVGQLSSTAQLESRTLSSGIPNFKLDNTVLKSAFYLVSSIRGMLIAHTLSEECRSDGRTGVVVEVILGGKSWQCGI